MSVDRAMSDTVNIGVKLLASMSLTFPGGNCFSQSVCQPQLDKRLSRHSQPARFPVQGLHHPSREIDVHSLRNGANPARLAQIELPYDFLACIEFPVKYFRFHSLSLTEQ